MLCITSTTLSCATRITWQGLTCFDRGRIAGNLRPQQPNAVEALLLL